MTISFVNDTAATSASGTTLTGSEPALTANGDLLRAELVIYDQNGGTITPPATGGAWVLKARNDYTVTRQGGGTRLWTHALYERPRDGTESFSWTIPNQYSEIYVAAYRTTLASISTSQIGTGNSGNTTTVTALGITAASAGFLVFSEVGYSDALTAGPAGMTAREVNFDGAALNIYDQSISSGATSDRTATITTDAADQTWSAILTLVTEVAASAGVAPRGSQLAPGIALLPGVRMGSG